MSTTPSAGLFGRCEAKTGTEPFGRLVEQVMITEPYASAQLRADDLVLSCSTPSPTPTLSPSSPSFAAPAISPSASCTRSGSSLIAKGEAAVSRLA